MSKGLPDFFFVDFVPLLLGEFDFGSNVSIFGKLHYDAEGGGVLVDESVFIPNDILIVEGCQYANLIKCVFPILIAHLAEFDLFHGVDFLVGDANHFEDLTKGPFSQFSLNLKLLELSS